MREDTFDTVLRLDGSGPEAPVVVEDISDTGICVSMGADAQIDPSNLMSAELVFRSADDSTAKLLHVPAEFVRIADRGAARLHLAFRFPASSPAMAARLRDIRGLSVA